MAGGRLWEPEEIARLRRMQPDEAPELARELGRTPAAIRTKRHLLGLAEAQWSPEDIAEVDRLIAGGSTIPEAAKAVGRTTKAIYALRKRLRESGIPVATASVRGRRGYRGRKIKHPADPGRAPHRAGAVALGLAVRRKPERERRGGLPVPGALSRGPAPKPSDDAKRRGELRRRIEARAEAERLAADLE